MCVCVCVCVCGQRIWVPFVSSLHFSSSHVDGVSTARLCAGVARGALLLSSPASRSPSLKGKGDVSSDHDAPRVREGGLHWGQCRCPSTGCHSGGPQGGSDTTPSTLVSFISGSTGPEWEGTQRGLEQNPRRAKGRNYLQVQETGKGRRAGKLFLYSCCQQDSLGLSPEQMKVGFPNQSPCNSPRRSPPWAHGWEDCKAVQKTNLHWRLPGRLVSHSWSCPGNRQ